MSEKWEVTYEEYKQLPHAQLIDVREKEERQGWHIGGDWIPLGQIPDQLDQISKDKSIILYCRSGRRSLHAAQMLRQKLNRENIYSLKGGIISISKNLYT